MFIQVRLLKGNQPLIYNLPEKWNKSNLIGSIVKIPLRNKKVLGIVEAIVPPVKTDFEIKSPYSIELLPNDVNYEGFAKSLAQYYQISSINIISRLCQFILKKSKQATITNEVQITIKSQSILTVEQKEIYENLEAQINQNKYQASLLHGVTGSGKTEIYKKLIEHAIAQNKSVIFLLPEVSLAVQFEQLFVKSLNDSVQTFAFYSGISEENKKRIWQSLLKEKPILIIGVHLPILLPISNLGLIIIDEEHDVGYQEKKHPKINSKEAALLRAKLYQIPILLGSATPSISSLFNVKHRDWNFFQLKKRYNGSFPSIEVINLKENKKKRNFWISEKLEKAITEQLLNKKQTIIFLNRRGFSFFVQCKICSFIFTCKNCSVSLTFHKNNWLYCHYCSLSMQYPLNCSKCKADKENFLKKGIGTEQAITILQKLFPSASIAKADLDTTSKKIEWQKTINEFKEGKIDILVGTQTITKGYHFPNVTLVGIIWADLNLHFPIYNAAETVLQQLIQVAGRAGRQSSHSKVIVQTMIDHRIFDYLNEINYLNFYTEEIKQRKIASYPPHVRFAEIEIKHTNEILVDSESQSIVNELIKNNKKDIQILGPVSPMVSKIKNKYIKRIYIKAKNINEITNLFSQIDQSIYKSKIYFLPNPLT